MNTDVLRDKSPRYEKLAKPRKRVDKSSNYDAFNVRRGALSYQITDSINKLAQPKRKPGLNTSSTSNFNGRGSVTGTDIQKLEAIFSTLNGKLNKVILSLAKEGYGKLINSNEQSKDAQESKKKKFLLDTYARITAARNRGCSKRLHELAKPKHRSPRIEAFDDFDDYLKTNKKYNAKPILLKKR